MFRKTKLNSLDMNKKSNILILSIQIILCVNVIGAFIGLIAFLIIYRQSKALVICAFVLSIPLISILLVLIVSKLKIIISNSMIKLSNPYVYYRELPNEYGIGVATLLMNSTIENEKDIVATILDLCARGYLRLEKNNDVYVVTVLKGIDGNLLSNEKFIMSYIIGDDIKNINYKEWFNYAIGDGKKLDLYKEREQKTSKLKSLNDMGKMLKFWERLKITFILVLVLLVIMCIFTEEMSGLFLGLISACISAFIISLIITIIYPLSILIIVFTYNLYILILMPIKLMINGIKNLYYKIMNDELIRTKKGKEEYQKLCSFKAFLNDFGNFKPKNAQEVILWDRYLAFAQVFGLTDSIMKSGYKELIENSAFKIDNIDNIYLTNIRLKQG